MALSQADTPSGSVCGVSGTCDVPRRGVPAAGDRASERGEAPAAAPPPPPPPWPTPSPSGLAIPAQPCARAVLPRAITCADRQCRFDTSIQLDLSRQIDASSGFATFGAGGAWQQLAGPPCVWSCCHERWSRLVGRRRAHRRRCDGGDSALKLPIDRHVAAPVVNRIATESPPNPHRGRRPPNRHLIQYLFLEIQTCTRGTSKALLI